MKTGGRRGGVPVYSFERRLQQSEVIVVVVNIYLFVLRSAYIDDDERIRKKKKKKNSRSRSRYTVESQCGQSSRRRKELSRRKRETRNG